MERLRWHGTPFVRCDVLLTDYYSFSFSNSGVAGNSDIRPGRDLLCAWVKGPVMTCHDLSSPSPRLQISTHTHSAAGAASSSLAHLLVWKSLPSRFLSRFHYRVAPPHEHRDISLTLTAAFPLRFILPVIIFYSSYTSIPVRFPFANTTSVFTDLFTIYLLPTQAKGLFLRRRTSSAIPKWRSMHRAATVVIFSNRTAHAPKLPDTRQGLAVEYIRRNLCR